MPLVRWRCRNRYITIVGAIMTLISFESARLIQDWQGAMRQIRNSVKGISQEKIRERLARYLRALQRSGVGFSGRNEFTLYLQSSNRAEIRVI